MHMSNKQHFRDTDVSGKCACECSVCAETCEIRKTTNQICAAVHLLRCMSVAQHIGVAINLGNNMCLTHDICNTCDNTDMRLHDVCTGIRVHARMFAHPRADMYIYIYIYIYISVCICVYMY